LLGVQADEYKKIYKKRFEEYETVFEHARSMNAAVDLADRISNNGKTSPLDFMIELSETLSQPGLNVEHIDKIEWQLEQYKIQGEEKLVSKEGVDVTIEDPVRHVGVLYGRIAVSDKDYRGSVSQFNKIITALRQRPRVENVEAIQMAVEVRSEKEFTDESGFNGREESINEKGKFALRIIIKAANDE